MTYLVYPWKPTDDDGAELRLSLRSVDAHLHLPSSLVPVVAGADRPSWYRGEWVSVPTVEGESPVMNMTRNLVAALENCDGDVLLMNDDFLLLGHREDVLPLHGTPWRDHVRCLPEWDADPSMGWYADATRATDAVLRHLPNPVSWETHVPMWLDAASAIGLFRGLTQRPACPLPRSLYGNVVGYGEHVRVYEGHDPLVLMAAGLHLGSSWISVNEVKTSKGVLALARARLKRASRWEA